MNHSLTIRVLSMVLVVLMLVSFVPTEALATESLSTTPETVTVNFDVNGGIGEYEPQQVALGGTIAKPESDPTHESAQFAYWTADLAEKVEWNFLEDTVTQDMTLYAVWVSATAQIDMAVTTSEKTALPTGNLPAGMDMISDGRTTLAPGVTMDEVVLYDNKGARVEMYVTTVDTTVDTVRIYANYKDNQNQSYGLQALSEQVAAMEAKYPEPFKVVAGINASYYNTTTGKPTGTFVMEGIDVTTESEGNNFAFFAVLKDGTYMIGNKGEYSQYKGQIKEAIGGYIHIVKDGAVVSGLDKVTKYPRQTIGLTADGKVILMTADGSQAPQTVGLTIQEQAEVMLSLGCVDALHLDGGNSATFGAIREGSDKFTTVNSPSGQAERAVSNTLVIVSTAVADGTFDHAVISGEYEYQLPYTTTTYSAIGVDASNAPANGIPESVTWALSDDSFGTIENGVFVSSGKLGDVDIQMTDNGKIVGSKTIHVVNPTAISFGGTETTVPYGKSAPLTVSALYGKNDVFCDADAFDLTINPAAAGTLDGFEFTAAAESTITNAVVTATYKYDAALAATSITVKFGKGSEVLFDFENGDISDWHGTETIFDWINQKNAENPDAKYPVSEPQNGYSNGIDKQTSSVFLATEENGGRVKNGQYALGFRMNHLQVTDVASWLYNYLYYTGETKVLRDVANGKAAARIGMWVYVPDVSNVAFRIVRGTTKPDGTKGITYKYMTSDYDNKSVSYSTNYGVPEAGWIYIYYNLTDLADSIVQTTSLYDPANNNGTAFGEKGGNYYPAFLQLFTGSATDTMNDIIYYIDDITLDFSDVTDDRDAPVISNTTVCIDGSNDVALTGQTVNTNLLSFSANVTDVSGNANATGLDYTTAKIYVDGIDMSGNAGFKAAGGIITLNNVNLNDGQHAIAFAIFDKQGNETRVTKTLIVDGSADNAKVSVVGRNEGNHTPKAGSVYFLDIKTTDASQIEAITTTLKLNTANKFEYENIICADGVTVTAEYDALDFELTVKLTHDGTLSGDAVLASIPVRVWAWDEEYTGITSENQFATKAIPVIDIVCKVTAGAIDYIDGVCDGYVTGFANALNVKTELDNKTVWHVHTAEAVADKAATCCDTGYTGRTYCAGCASVIDWGTTLAPIDHSYSMVDGILKCECGKLFNGVFTDGKTYVDGVAMADGWVEDSYYKNGVLMTGVQKVPAPGSTDEFYYNFGEDGVCTNKIKYEGVFFDSIDNVYRYSKVGVVSSGWFNYNDAWYYFLPDTMAAATGNLKVGDVAYDFDVTGKVTAGVWATTLYGTRYYYGPNYVRQGWITVDGKDYYIDSYYRLENGYYIVYENLITATWYHFDENGVCDRNEVIPDGFYTNPNGMGYSRNGLAIAGHQTIDGENYYFHYRGYAKTGFIEGRFYGEDYKGVTGIIDVNGELCYYLKGYPKMAGLIEIEGDYYFAGGKNGQVSIGNTYVWEGNGILPEGNYVFGADGKMLQGVHENNGTYYYYLNGQPKMAGLVEVDGEYYFAYGKQGEVAVGTMYVWQGNGILPEDTYEFAADGKMLNGIVKKDNGLYYYENGKYKMAGLVEVDGELYFAGGARGEVSVGKQYVWKSNDLVPNGTYEFDEEGRMCDGIVEVNGELCYYVKGQPKMAGLVEFDGAYYFAGGKNGQVSIGLYYVWQGNGILPNGNYEFGADGKMLQGIVEKNGELCYYVNGQPKLAGLVEVDGAYYFAGGKQGQVLTGLQYVWQGNGILPEANYEFGADGKMLQGLVQKDDGLYYYENGQPKMAGLIEVDGAYYFAGDSKGRVSVGKQYVWKANGLMDEDNYEFGTDGKMLDGFVTKDGGLYYYENGKYGTVGLNYIDGYYYFIDYGGKVIVNRTYYVWQTNGLSISMNYKFDAQGRAVI